jgi:hypothetical protein
MHNFQIMISSGGMMKYDVKHEDVKLQMGDYQLKYQMLSIDMGGWKVVFDA